MAAATASPRPESYLLSAGIALLGFGFTSVIVTLTRDTESLLFNASAKLCKAFSMLSIDPSPFLQLGGADVCVADHYLQQMVIDVRAHGIGDEGVLSIATVNVTEIYVAAVVDKRPDNKFYLSEMVNSEGIYVRIEESPSGNSKNGVTDGARDSGKAGFTAGPEGLSEGGNPSAQSAEPTPLFDNNISNPERKINTSEGKYLLKQRPSSVAVRSGLSPTAPLYNLDMVRYNMTIHKIPGGHCYELERRTEIHEAEIRHLHRAGDPFGIGKRALH